MTDGGYADNFVDLIIETENCKPLLLIDGVEHKFQNVSLYLVQKKMSTLLFLPESNGPFSFTVKVKPLYISTKTYESVIAVFVCVLAVLLLLLGL